jgi:hypothetical protein
VSNDATGDNSIIIVGGCDHKNEDNSHPSKATGNFSCVVGGGANEVSGTAASAHGSVGCVCEGAASVCLGGQDNHVNGEQSIAIGGRGNMIHDNKVITIGSSRCQAQTGENNNKNERSVIVGSYKSTIGAQEVAIINSNFTEIKHDQTTAIGGNGHPTFATLEDITSIVSIMGFQNEKKYSGIVVVNPRTEVANTKTYIQNVGGWDGTEETIMEATDVATVIASLTDRIKNLEDKLSKVATILLPEINENETEESSPALE